MPKLTPIQRQQIHSKFDGVCAYCGERITVKEMQVDHVIPQADMIYNRTGEQFKNQKRIPEFLKHLTPFDLDHPDNLFPACRVCNKWKSAHSLETFRSELEAQAKRLDRDSAAYRMAKRYQQVIERPRPVKFFFETRLTDYCEECKGPCKRKGISCPGEENE